MTREDCIKAMARARHSQACDGGYTQVGYMNATAAYDAMQDHIRAERERVREMCAEHFDDAATEAEGRFAFQSAGESSEAFTKTANIMRALADDIRALDIGGKTDG